MTHQYTLLVGGVVIPGGGAADATAIAWAGGTVLALGSDAEVRSISRGDSHVVDLAGATVIPHDPVAGPPSWPTTAVLEVGGPTTLAVLERDPRLDASTRPLVVRAVVNRGRVVAGALPAGR